MKDHLTAALDQAKDRWLLLLQRASDRARLSGDGAVQTGFFGDGGRIALVPCDDINLISLDRALQPHGRHLGDKAGAQLFGHGLDIVLVQIQFVGDLPVRQKLWGERRGLRHHRCVDTMEEPMAKLYDLSKPLSLSRP